jgi:hypothetical protein
MELSMYGLSGPSFVGGLTGWGIIWFALSFFGLLAMLTPTSIRKGRSEKHNDYLSYALARRLFVLAICWALSACLLAADLPARLIFTVFALIPFSLFWVLTSQRGSDLEDGDGAKRVASKAAKESKEECFYTLMGSKIPEEKETTP